MSHLISIEDLERTDIERIVSQAERFAEVSDREIKTLPTLRGRMVLNLFYESSTRTRSSFELAAKRLSADVVNFAASGSSVEKGESLKDTVLTLSAHKPDAIVLRTPWAGAAELVSGWCTAAIVNAGDGKHEHPTQALLDVYTLRQHLGAIDGASIWIVGDVAHSRVARSNVLAFQRMGAKVTVAGPPTLIPRGIEELGCEVRYTLDELDSADVVYALRMQHERMNETWVPSMREYAALVPDQRQAPGAAPDADAPGPGQPRRGALGRGRRLAAGGDHRAGRGGRGRAHGGALRAARRAPRAAARGPPTRRRAGRRVSATEPLIGGPQPPANVLLRDVRVLDPRTGSTRATTYACEKGASRSWARPGIWRRHGRQELIDGGGRLRLLPAFFDPHVHLRTPGQEHKEDLETGTRAAAAGGFGAVIAMPNTDPVLDSAPLLRSLRDAAAREARVPVGFLPAITRGLEGEQLTEMAELGRRARWGSPTTGGRCAARACCARRSQYQRLCGGVLSLHEEDPTLSRGGAMHEGAVSAALGIGGIPSVSESTMVARDAALAGYEDARVHFQHLSCAASVQAVAAAKANGCGSARRCARTTCC